MAVDLGSTFEEVIKKINSCGDVTAAGDNTFTGSNVFKKAVTLYTDAVNGNSMSATLDSYKLKLLNDLGSVYADLNITDDTVPYLELKTAGHGKVKYTSESIIFTDTYGSSKTTTLKFPGQGATADSIQTLATLKDLDKKQPLLVSGTNIKTINGQSILGSGNLEISGGGSGSVDLEPIVKGQHKLNKGEQLTIQQGYTYFVQCFDTSDNIAELEIVGGNRNGEKGKFVMLLSGQGDNLAILQTGSIVISNLVKTAVRVEAIKPASNSSYLAYYEISGYASSTKTLNVGGGSPDSNAPVLISISSVKNITSEAHINVRVISGTLQAGDRIELCKPIKKTAYNRINGVKTNIRKRHRLKTVVFSTITENDIQNYKNGKNIFTILLQTSGSNEKITSIDHSYTYDSSPLKSPLTVRIVRQTKLLNSTQNIQISNSVYLTLNYYSQVLKPM